MRSNKDDKKKAWQAEEQKHLDRLAISDDRKSERSVSSTHSSRKPVTPKRPSDQAASYEPVEEEKKAIVIVPQDQYDDKEIDLEESKSVKSLRVQDNSLYGFSNN